MAFENRKSNLLEMAQGLSIRIDCIHDKSEGYATDLILSSLEQAYSHGRADCLQETLDLKKPLLPHELKLIERLLDYACGEFSINDIPDTFELADTKRHADLKIDISNWFKMGPEADRSKDWDRDLMSYMAHRVREALAEEEG